MSLLRPKQIDNHIANRLKNIRDICGISQEELGNLIGVSSQQIQKYESGKDRISASRLFEISQVINKPISVFFHGIVADADCYNYDFLDETTQISDLVQENKEILTLIKSFQKIKNSQLRKDLLRLVKSMASNDEIKKNWYF